MTELTLIAIDTSKHVFTLHGVDAGGRQRMGGISRQGNERLRQLLVLGATAVVKVVKPGHRHGSAWLLGLLARKPRKVAAVAQANKMARIVWAMDGGDKAGLTRPSTHDPHATVIAVR